MNSPNLTTVPLPPANGRSIGDDSRRPASRGMLREPGHRIKTGENSRPTNGEYSTPAHSNMDNKELGVGCIVYFPILEDGALFSAGDGHALQGDGEVCLTAIETALEGTFELYLRTDLSLTLPRAETADAWITMGFDEDLDDAVKMALRDMIVLIRERAGLSAQNAYTLCSIAADLRVTQTVDGNKGIHCVLAKGKLPLR